MNNPIPISEMKKILEERFPFLFGFVFGIIEQPMHLGNLVIKKEIKKEEITNLKSKIKAIEEEVSEYCSEFFENFNDDTLDDLEEDLSSFKNEIFAEKLWTVRSALHDVSNPELDRYRESFDNATPREIFIHTRAVLDATKIYLKENFPKIDLSKVSDVHDLNLDYLDDEKMFMTGVIGYGIRSELLHRMYPSAFAIMTRRTLWAMFFLTNQNEFIIDENRNGQSRTSHYWNYEYDRFCYYNNFLTNMFDVYLKRYKITIKPELRFGYINLMLVEFSRQYREEINDLYRWKPMGL